VQDARRLKLRAVVHAWVSERDVNRAAFFKGVVETTHALTASDSSAVFVLLSGCRVVNWRVRLCQDPRVSH
jgi:hypothetical protein